jgi:N-methylhydantoinase B/oxoprolinase/acetone carboxylase alpha subunit
MNNFEETVTLSLHTYDNMKDDLRSYEEQTDMLDHLKESVFVTTEEEGNIVCHVDFDKLSEWIKENMNHEKTKGYWTTRETIADVRIMLKDTNYKLSDK